MEGWCMIRYGQITGVHGPVSLREQLHATKVGGHRSAKLNQFAAKLFSLARSAGLNLAGAPRRPPDGGRAEKEDQDRAERFNPPPGWRDRRDVVTRQAAGILRRDNGTPEG
jgi:hypothetical protein